MTHIETNWDAIAMRTNVMPVRSVSALVSAWVSAWVSALLVAGSFAAGHASEDAGELERCVSISRIDSLDILSNRQIIFELIGGKYYVNNLPYPCPGLRPSSALMYRTSLSQLCNVDVVTVLESAGGGLMPRASCGLGMFEPVDEEAVKALRGLAREEDFH